MGHHDHIAKPITSSHSLSMRRNKVNPFSEEPEIPRKAADSLNSGLHKEASFSSSPVSLDGWDLFSHPISTTHRSLGQTFRTSTTDLAAGASLWPNWTVAIRLGQIFFFFWSVQWSLLYLHHVKKKHPPQFFSDISHAAIAGFIHFLFCMRRSPRDFSDNEKSGGWWWFSQFND